MADDLLNGAEYCAVRRISTADDETLADVGEVCTRVPAAALTWLLAEGSIAPGRASDQAVAPEVLGALDPVPESQAS